MRRLLALALLPLALLAQTKEERQEQEVAARFAAGTGPDLAWGAYLAAQYGRGEYVPQIEGLLTHEDAKVRQNALYALARLGATTPIEKLTPFLPQEFDAVMFLLSRQPTQARPLLLEWSKKELTDHEWSVVHSLLAITKTPGQAAVLLRDWRFGATVGLTDLHIQETRIVDGICGWPVEPPTYPPRRPPTIVASQRAYSAIASSPHPLTLLQGCPDRDHVDRSSFTLDYLRHIGDTIPPPPFGVKYTTSAALKREWTRLQREWREFLAVLKASLIYTGAITESEWVEPRVEWKIRDLRKDRSVPLPALH